MRICSLRRWARRWALWSLAIAAGLLVWSCKKDNKSGGKDDSSGIVKGDKPPPLAKGAQRWKAVVQLGMNPVELTIDFAQAKDGKWTAKLGVPRQKVWNIPLKDVEFSDEQVKFTLHKPEMPQANEVYEAKREPKGGDKATGTMTMKGGKVPFDMTRMAAGEKFASALERPQTPKAPFPYPTRELTTTNPKDGIKRAGVLSIPKGTGKFPVVIIESGSGAHDRHGTFAQHKPYLVIGDYLTRKGIATYRTDDRGVGKSTGVDRDASYEDLAGDMLAMIADLKKQPEIDGTKIGIMGHSQGGTIAPLAAAQSGDVAFVIMLAGMGVNGQQVMYDQKRLILQSAGVEGDQLAKINALQKKMLELIATDAPKDQLLQHIEKSIAAEMNEEQQKQLTAENKKQLIDQAYATITAQFMKSLIKNDPQTYLTKVKVPVLAIFGDKDLQVEPISNEQGVKKHLATAGNTDVTTWIVPQMSHNLQKTETGKLEEYGRNPQTVRPDVLEKIASWIQSKTGLAKPDVVKK